MIEPWREEFSLTAQQVGWIVGTAFWGFTLAMVLIGPLVDLSGIYLSLSQPEKEKSIISVNDHN